MTIDLMKNIVELDSTFRRINMVDKELLEEVIKDSGIKKRAIAQKLKISEHGLSNKINNISEFKVSEVLLLEEILNLSVPQTRLIFFSRGVDFNSTRGRA